VLHLIKMWLECPVEETGSNERPAVVCLAVKPVGKPDAGNRHVSEHEPLVLA
jgi:hypothetical protein